MISSDCARLVDENHYKQESHDDGEENKEIANESVQSF
jgi:hypothetical protein